MVPKITRENFYPLLIFVFFLALFYLTSRSVPEESIRQLLEQTGIFAPVIFVFLVFVTNVFAPLSSTPLFFAGFYAFGPQVVFLFTFANIFSSITNFWIARFFGRSLVEKFIGQTNIQRLDQLTKDYGLLTLFLLRVFQGGLHDFISYAAGLTSIKFTPYFLVSLLGIIPGTTLWYIIARHAQSPFVFTLMTLGLIWVFSLSFLGALALKKLIPKK